MFKKPFTTKKNTAMRSSDKKKLLQRLHELTAEPLRKFSQVNHMKLITAGETTVNLYIFDKIPMLFDFDQSTAVFPTVYAMWADPLFCPMLLVHEQVLQYLENGADLMLPGVIRSEAYPMPEFGQGVPVCVGTIDRNGQMKGPVAVGVSLLSSAAMLNCGMQGRGLQTVHVYRDHLWELGDRSAPPVIDLAQLMRNAVAESTAPEAKGTEEVTDAVGDLRLTLTEGESALDAAGSAALENTECGSKSKDLSENVGETGEAGQSETEDATPSESADSLLRRCFIAGLKYRLAKSTLPMEIGQFYAHCLLRCLPPNQRVDIKKTKYKKFSTFLKEVNKAEQGPLVKTTVNKAKGIELICEVNWNHPLIVDFRVTDERTKDSVATDESAQKKHNGPVITEYLSVTEAVIPLLGPECRAGKGDLLTGPQLREIITAYVKAQNLNSGKDVRMNPLLSSVSGIKTDTSDWNSLIQKIANRMTKTFLLVLPDGREIVKKIKMPTVVFKVETRSGNKKMTLVNNLAAFGLDPKAVAKQIQINVAASATLGEAPACEGPQLAVQGNQVLFVGDLLMNEYGIDKKYIQGLELAPKKKK